MPSWGSFRWGVGHKWGHGDATAATAEEREVLGGYAPWLGYDYQVAREASFSIWSVNPTTLANEVNICDAVVGGSINGKINDWDMEEDTLGITLLDEHGDLLSGGDLTDLIARNRLIRVAVSVTNPAGTVTRNIRLFRTTTVPSWNDDNGTEVTLNAIDWLRPILHGDPQLQASSILGMLARRDQVMLDTGGDFQGIAPDSFAGLVFSWYWMATGSTLADPRVIVDGLFSTQPLPPDRKPDPPGPPVLQNGPIDDLVHNPNYTFTQPGEAMLTGDGVLETLHKRFVGFIAVYDGEGRVHLRPWGDRNTVMGYGVSCTDAGQRVALPVETVTRTVTDPQYTQITVTHYREDVFTTDAVPATPPWMGSDAFPESGGGIPATKVTKIVFEIYRETRSGKRDHPHDILGRTERIDWHQQGTAGGPPETVPEILEARLRNYLGDADIVALGIDSAYPPPVLNEDIIVHLPEKNIGGYYRVTSFSIPLSEALASWQTRWSADAF